MNYDSWLSYSTDDYYKEEYECTECGKPVESEGVCSNVCYNASML